jgi:predicted CopG family antitoxin
MLHNLTITVDDSVYQTLKPMVERQTIGVFLHDLLQCRPRECSALSIKTLRGTLRLADTSDLRDESDRLL